MTYCVRVAVLRILRLDIRNDATTPSPCMPCVTIRSTKIGLMATTSTHLRQHVNAPRAAVYRALLNARAVATWMVPQGMTSQVHLFDGREGGAFRISLTYDTPRGTGKTTHHTDTYHGHFVTLVPDERVVQVMDCTLAKIEHNRRLST